MGKGAPGWGGVGGGGGGDVFPLALFIPQPK
jgi:hypothetical protein